MIIKIIKTIVIGVLIVPAVFAFFLMVKAQIDINLIYGDFIQVTLLKKGTSPGAGGGYEDNHEFTFLNEDNIEYKDTMRTFIRMGRRAENLGDFIYHSRINDKVVLKTYNKHSGRVVEWKNKSISYIKVADQILSIVMLLFWGTIGFFCFKGIIRIWTKA